MTSEKRSFSDQSSGDRCSPRDSENKTMADVDHTHPHTNETFGSAFQRGPALAADGGERDADATDADTMADVDHEPPADGVSRSFERGTEGRDETV